MRKYVNSDKGSQDGERTQDQNLKKTGCSDWGSEGRACCLISRAGSGTGSANHSQRVFLSTERKSFPAVRSVRRWSGLLPGGVSCLSWEAFWPPFHRERIQKSAGNYWTPLICQAPSITLASFILQTERKDVDRSH